MKDFHLQTRQDDKCPNGEMLAVSLGFFQPLQQNVTSWRVAAPRSPQVSIRLKLTLSEAGSLKLPGGFSLQWQRQQLEALLWNWRFMINKLQGNYHRCLSTLAAPEAAAGLPCAGYKRTQTHLTSNQWLHSSADFFIMILHLKLRVKETIWSSKSLMCKIVVNCEFSSDRWGEFLSCWCFLCWFY